MSVANDNFQANLKKIYAGRRTVLDSAHAAHKSNHSTLLTSMDTDWSSMTSAEKTATRNVWQAASSNPNVRVPTSLTWPKYVFIGSADVSDLLTRYV